MSDIAVRARDPNEFSSLTEPYRRELQVHCYRILGSLQDAEDLVQETLLRAWRRIDTYAGRASLRAWLYKIATNACLDVLDKQPRRGLPAAMYAPADPHAPPRPPVLEPIWLEPLPDDLLADLDAGPDARYSLRESVSLAFLAALQALPPRQRAVLLLCDVLDWRAAEVAGWLGLTASAVNSALHRARVTLTRHHHAAGREGVKPLPAGDRRQALLDRYVRAWEAADIEGLTALLREDAGLSMPPSPSWHAGRESIRTFLTLAIFGDTIFVGAADARWRLRPTQANGQPAAADYLYDAAAGVYRAFGIQVLTLDGDQIAAITSFINPALAARFGLPDTLPAK